MAVAMAWTLAVRPAARAAEPAPAAVEQELEGEGLPVPPLVRAQAQFWKRIFSTYSKDQVVVHDPDDPSRVYRVLDFRPLRETGLPEGQLEDAIDKEVKREEKRIIASLRRLQKSGAAPAPGSEETRLKSLFHGAKRSEYGRAAERIRAQRGISERFEQGIAVSRRYFPEIEAVFREENVPVSLSRLALVESGFNLEAYSRVGAAGVWQFMPSTGRLFLRIDHAVDERLDPFRAGRAAAKLLRQNYDELGTWPLAVTAYNHGRYGMARAVKQLGSRDIEDVIRRYRSRTFKFASRNFYAEVIAAIEVDRDHRDHFGDVDFLQPVRAREVTLPDYVPLAALSGAVGMDASSFIELNPALTREVRLGKLHVPKGYPVRLPADVAARFDQTYASLAPELKFKEQRRTYVLHHVRKGQNLTTIARHYGTTVRNIQRENRMRGTRILIGQKLKIPRGGSRAVQHAARSMRQKYLLHRVRRGQTLSSIARRYGTTVRAIQHANRLRGSRILAGQTLKVPRG